VPQRHESLRRHALDAGFGGEGMASQAFVPLGHSALILSSRVHRLVERFIASGSFE
jgi:hypothetical protein